VRLDNPATHVDEEGQVDPLAAAAQSVIDTFCDANNWGEREQECVRRCDRDGEAFVWLFHDGGGSCEGRFIEPEHVRSPSGRESATFGVETEPGDVEGVRGYWVVKSPTVSLEPEFVEAEEIVHVKLNVDSTAKRGLPTFMPVRKNLERANELLGNMSIL